MIIVTAYIEQLPSPISNYVRNRYQDIRKYYQPTIPLEQHDLKGVGAFVLIEKSAELNDLSLFHLHGGLENQYIEFIKFLPNICSKFYEVYIVVDTDNGISLLFEESILNQQQLDYIKEVMMND